METGFIERFVWWSPVEIWRQELVESSILYCILTASERVNLELKRVTNRSSSESFHHKNTTNILLIIIYVWDPNLKFILKVLPWKKNSSGPEISSDF